MGSWGLNHTPLTTTSQAEANSITTESGVEISVYNFTKHK